MQIRSIEVAKFVESLKKESAEASKVAYVGQKPPLSCQTTDNKTQFLHEIGKYGSRNIASHGQ
jgi:hypothetical protein